MSSHLINSSDKLAPYITFSLSLLFFNKYCTGYLSRYNEYAMGWTAEEF